MASNLYVSAISRFDPKGLNAAEKSIKKFDKTSARLTKSFAAAFSIIAIKRFASASVKGFLEDEKAARALEVQLKNTGNAFSNLGVMRYLEDLETATNVTKDQLRPAFQSLLTVTKSVIRSQEGLSVALDVSAGTGKSVASVANALAKGYAGQTSTLGKLVPALDKVLLKTGDMAAISAELTKLYGGQAIQATKGFQGQLDDLSIAASRARDTIGKGLVESIAVLGGEDGINTAVDAMAELADNISDATYGMALLIAKVQKLGSFAGPNIGKTMALVMATLAGAAAGSTFMGIGAIPGAAIGLTAGLTAQQLGDYGKRAKGLPAQSAAYSPTSMYFTQETSERAKLTAIIKKETQLLKDKNKQTAAELAAKKKQSELDDLKKEFDIDRINLEYILANSKDSAEKARVRSMLAIMDDDLNAAAKRQVALDKANAHTLQVEYDTAIALGDLGLAARLAAMGVKEIMIGNQTATQYYASSGNDTGAIGFIQATQASNESLLAMQEAEAAGQFADDLVKEALAAVEAGRQRAEDRQSKYGNSSAFNTSAINLTINAPLGSEDTITQYVKNAMLELNRYGDSTSYAGAIF
jgi:hypothetical protein